MHAKLGTDPGRVRRDWDAGRSPGTWATSRLPGRLHPVSRARPRHGRWRPVPGGPGNGASRGRAGAVRRRQAAVRDGHQRPAVVGGEGELQDAGPGPRACPSEWLARSPALLSGGAHGGTDASLCRCRHRASWKVGAQGPEPGRFRQTNSDYGRTSGDWMRWKDASSGDPLGSVRGRPNLVITLLSKRVIALTLSPARVMTKRPKMWATPEVGSWR
jgi:hypothetical protein